MICVKKSIEHVNHAAKCFDRNVTWHGRGLSHLHHLHLVWMVTICCVVSSIIFRRSTITTDVIYHSLEWADSALPMLFIASRKTERIASEQRRWLRVFNQRKWMKEMMSRLAPASKCYVFCLAVWSVWSCLWLCAIRKHHRLSKAAAVAERAAH